MPWERGSRRAAAKTTTSSPSAASSASKSEGAAALNYKFTEQDFIRAKEIRKTLLSRFVKDPVFTQARATLDAAEANAPLPSTNNNAPSSGKPIVAQRNTDALAALKKNLKGIHSEGTHFFQDTVPAATSETATRVLIASDVVANPNRPANAQQQQQQEQQQRGTSININARPHNTESFNAERSTFFEGTPFMQDEKSKKLPGMGFRIKIKLAPNSADLEKQVIGFFQQILKMKPNPDKKIDITVVEENNGDRFAVVTGADFSGTKDPLQKVVKLAARSAMKSSGSSVEKEVAAPDLFRLLTATLDFPEAIGDWLAREEATWPSFIEGFRLAFEIISRDRASVHAHGELAHNLLGSFNAKKLRKMVAKIAALSFSKETSFRVNVAPVDVLFGHAVRDGAEVWRNALLAKDNAVFRGVEDVDAFKQQMQDTTILEEAVALVVGLALNVGATSNTIKRVVTREVALRSQLKAYAKAKQQIDIIFSVKKLFGEIASIDILSPSGALNVAFRGFDSRILDVLPSSPQEVIDAVKPIWLASREEWDETKPETNPDQLDVSMDEQGFPFEFYEKFFDEVLAPNDYIKGVVADCPVLGSQRKMPWRAVGQKFQKRTCLRKGDAPSSAWDFYRDPVDVEAVREAIAACGGDRGGSVGHDRAARIRVGGSSDDDDDGYGYDADDADVESRIASRRSSTASLPCSAAAARAPPGRAKPTDEQLRSLFAEFDEDDSGMLEKNELASLFLSNFPWISASDMNRLIREADANHDNKLSFQEFKNMATKLL